MGLLDRVRTLDKYTSSEEKSLESTSFYHSPGQIDYPGAVFHFLQTLIGFRKGSLLFPDPSGKGFYTWLSLGFDRTTSRRMLIPKSLPAFYREDSPVIWLKAEELTGLLSNRELGMVDDYIIIRMGNTFSPSAILLAADFPEADSSSLKETAELRNLFQEFGEGIGKSRRMVESANDEATSDLRKWLNTNSTGINKAILVTIDITDAVESFIRTVPELEFYRARKDTVNLIRHITGRMGRIRDLKDRRILILFPGERLPDYELYIHNLSRTFASTFFDMTPLPDFQAEFNIWPEESDVIEENLSGFFQSGTDNI